MCRFPWELRLSPSDEKEVTLVHKSADEWCPSMTFGTYERILQLLEQVHTAPKQAPPIGAVPEQIASVERQLGYSLPAELRHWLTVQRLHRRAVGLLWRPSGR